MSGSGQIRDKETNVQSDLENTDNSQQSSDETNESTDQNIWDALFHSGAEITKTNIAQISLLDQINIDSYDIVWSPDGKRLYLTANHVLYVYSTSNLKEITSIDSNNWLHCLALSSDGKKLAYETKEALQIIDTNSWEVLQTIQSENPSNEFVFSNDGQLLAASDTENNLLIWNLETEELILSIEYPYFEINIMTIDFSSDDQLIATGCQDSARIWGISTGEEVYWDEDVYTQDLLFYPDNSKLVYSDDDVINILSLSNLNVINTLDSGNGYDIKSLALSPNGELLASGDEKGNVVFWDAQTGDELYRIQANTWANYLTFSPDGTILAYKGGRDSGVMLLEFLKFGPPNDSTQALRKALFQLKHLDFAYYYFLYV